MEKSKEIQPLSLAQERARFEKWVKEERIPNIRRQHHWKTWLRALGIAAQDLRVVENLHISKIENPQQSVAEN